MTLRKQWIIKRLIGFPVYIGSLLPIVIGCQVNKPGFSPTKKYSKDQVEADYNLYEDILKTHHPSLYWYTPADSMNYYFNWGREQLKDGMTEPEFRRVLSYVTSKINCG